MARSPPQRRSRRGRRSPPRSAGARGRVGEGQPHPAQATSFQTYSRDSSATCWRQQYRASSASMALDRAMLACEDAGNPLSKAQPHAPPFTSTYEEPGINVQAAIPRCDDPSRRECVREAQRVRRKSVRHLVAENSGEGPVWRGDLEQVRGSSDRTWRRAMGIAANSSGIPASPSAGRVYCAARPPAACLRPPARTSGR